ncbi:MAG: hypothetical protein Q9222_004808 [Ikaeria aurantiellina]
MYLSPSPSPPKCVKHQVARTFVLYLLRAIYLLLTIYRLHESQDNEVIMVKTIKSVCLLAHLLCLTTSVAAEKAWRGWPSVDKIFAFGSSYPANGFDLNGVQPDAAANNHFGNPPGYGHTSSGGPNVFEYIATKYSKSSIALYDLAVGGAIVDGSVYGEKAPSNDFVAQIDTKFMPKYSDKAKAGWSSEKTLFAFWFAINDVIRSYEKLDPPNAAIISTYTRLIDKLYKTGARNFLFLNVPPISRSPSIIAKGPAAQSLLAKEVFDFNVKIGLMIKNFESTHPDAKVVLADAHGFLNQVLDNPAKFPQTQQIKDTKGYCGPYANPPQQYFKDPGCEFWMHQYFWINNAHPTWPVHEALAADIARQLEA